MSQGFSPLPISGALQGVDPRIVEMTAQAWGYVMPPGSRIVATTGVSSHSPVNHAPGHAIDYHVLRPDGTRVRWNDPETLNAAIIGRSLGVHGIGAGEGYMGGNAFHWDISRNGPRTWSDSGANQNPTGFGLAEYASRISAATGQPLEQVLASLDIAAPQPDPMYGGFLGDERTYDPGRPPSVFNPPPYEVPFHPLQTGSNDLMAYNAPEPQNPLAQMDRQPRDNALALAPLRPYRSRPFAPITPIPLVQS